MAGFPPRSRAMCEGERDRCAKRARWQQRWKSRRNGGCFWCCLQARVGGGVHSVGSQAWNGRCSDAEMERARSEGVAVVASKVRWHLSCVPYAIWLEDEGGNEGRTAHLSRVAMCTRVGGVGRRIALVTDALKHLVFILHKEFPSVLARECSLQDGGQHEIVRRPACFCRAHT